MPKTTPLINPGTQARHRRGAVYIAVYLATIVASAALVTYIGVIPVGLGLMAPAGAYVIGVTMVFRDLAQDQLGPRWTYAALLVGTLLSVLVSPSIAFAAAVAFLVSETLDQLTYTPLRKHSLVIAVLASNAVGIVADSLLFTQLAFGSTEFAVGQMWAKAVSTVAAVVVLKMIYRHRTTQTPAYLLARDQPTLVKEYA